MSHGGPPISQPSDGRRRSGGLALGPALGRLLPVFAIVVFVAGVAITLAVAGDTLGFDFLAYHAAATRVLHGQPAYDMSYAASGGFGLFYYPPTFIPLVLPFGLLPAGVATWTWIAGLLVAFGAGVAVLPVRRRTQWIVVLLAGVSWPFLFAIKLGQVGPLLFLLFAIGWRWIDRGRSWASPAPSVRPSRSSRGSCWLGVPDRRWAAVVSGGIVSRSSPRSRRWSPGPAGSTSSLIGRVTDPITTPNNVTRAPSSTRPGSRGARRR